ncbi:hypothetical protein [Mesobacterium pallidum]|uniref:hypothetical protein n=1 Tax=Mesobacterium pallidum TaxID=2872037 RepID=UPI001EE2BC1C|nr:hypothetical protein [Mesobacterium pallidum]
MFRLVTADDLARDLGYRNATPAFWAYVRRIGLETAPGKPFAFDMDTVTNKLGRSM